MSGFTKLFSSIIHSTIWREDMHVKITWITMLAMADPNGNVNASVPGLADAARVTLEQVENALERLKSPDAYSRSKEYDGRRIVSIDGGWFILNFPKYRELRNRDQRREQTRNAVRKHRAKKKLDVSSDAYSKQCKPRKAQAEAEAEAEVATLTPSESCSEPEQAPPSELLSFPCHKDGVQWHLTESKLAEYQETFPHLDVLASLRQARQWCIDNPVRRKTPKGMPRFCSSWLARAQNSGRGGSPGGGYRNKLTDEEGAEITVWRG